MSEISIYLDENKRPFLQITGDGKNENFVLHPLICEDPLCNCTEIDLTLIALDNSCECFRFVLDWKTMEPVERSGGLSESSRAMMERILTGCDNKFWNPLRWLFYRGKHAGDPSSIAWNNKRTWP